MGSSRLSSQTGNTSQNLFNLVNPSQGLPYPNGTGRQTLLGHLQSLVRKSIHVKGWIPQIFLLPLSGALEIRSHDMQEQQQGPKKLSRTSLAESSEDDKPLIAPENGDDDSDEKGRIMQAEKRAYIQRELADVLKRARWLEESGE